MLVNMIRSRVLMPYTETEEGGKKQIRLPFIKMADDRQMIALFTDFVEFSSFTAEKDLRLRGMDFKGLKNFAFPESCAGFLLNPATVAIPFTKKWIQSVQVRDPQGEAKNKSQVEE